MTLLGAQNILGEGCEVEGEEKEKVRARSGMTAATDEALAIDPLLSPQMRHGHGVCLTTPHPLHLLRSEQG